jgi:hypothetical protein
LSGRLGTKRTDKPRRADIIQHARHLDHRLRGSGRRAVLVDHQAGEVYGLIGGPEGIDIEPGRKFRLYDAELLTEQRLQAWGGSQQQGQPRS